MSILSRIGNTFHNDVVAPVERVVHPQTQPKVNVQQLANALQVHAVNNPILQQSHYQAMPALPVQVAMQQPLHVGNQVITQTSNARVRPDNTLQLNQLLHPSLGQQVKTELGQKLVVPSAAVHTIGGEIQQFAGRPAVTIAGALAGKQRTFNTPVTRAIAGNAPVQNLQKNVVNNYQTHSSLPVPLRVGLAGLDAAGQVINALPDIGAAAKGAKILNDARLPLGDLKLADDSIGSAKLPLKGSGNVPTNTAPDDNLLTTMDKVIAQTTGQSPGQTARSLEGDQAALDHLKSGGTRDEAAKVYQKTTGSTVEQAQFAVKRVAKEADQALHPNVSGTNPELDNFKVPNVKPGDYTEAAKRPGIVNNLLNIHEAHSLDTLNKLSSADRSNFIHYVQDTEDVSKAENPQAVQTAIDAFRKGANVTHALDTTLAGGKTRYIKDFFPDYVDQTDEGNLSILQHKAEQQAEEDIGPEEWGKMTADEKAAEIGQRTQTGTLAQSENYGGFRSKGRIFANRKEILAAKLKPMFEDPAEDIKRYFTGAKLNVGSQSLIKAAREADVNEPLIRNSIDLPNGPSFQVSDNALKTLKQFRRKIINPLQKVTHMANTTVIKTIVANPIFHGGNQEFNALLEGATRMPGNKVVNALKLIRHQGNITDADRYAFYKEGNFSPTYGKDNYGFIAKGLQKAGIDPTKAEFSPRSMAALEENIRVSLWKVGKERGLSPADNTKIINQVLGSPAVLNDMTNSVGLFLHYFTNNVKLLGDTGVRASKGDIAPLVGLAVGTAAWLSATKAWQAVTNNPNASVRAPGMLGVATSLLKAPGQIKEGKIPSVITNHINPGILTGVEQLANRDLHRAVIGKKSQYNTLDGKYGSGRLKTAASNLVGPVGTVQDVTGGRSSLLAAALGYATGLYNDKLPTSVPNTSGNKSGSGLTKRELKATNPDELSRWVNMTAKARINVQTANPDKFIRDQQLKVQNDISQGKTTQAFKDSKTVAQTQIYRNYDPNIVQAYGLSATDFKSFLAQSSATTVNQLKQLDSQLVQSGLVAKSKFTKSATGGSSSSSKVSFKLPAKPKAFKVGKAPKIAKLKTIKFKTAKLAKTPKSKVKLS